MSPAGSRTASVPPRANPDPPGRGSARRAVPAGTAGDGQLPGHPLPPGVPERGVSARGDRRPGHEHRHGALRVRLRQPLLHVSRTRERHRGGAAPELLLACPPLGLHAGAAARDGGRVGGGAPRHRPTGSGVFPVPHDGAGRGGRRSAAQAIDPRGPVRSMPRPRPRSRGGGASRRPEPPHRPPRAPTRAHLPGAVRPVPPRALRRGPAPSHGGGPAAPDARVRALPQQMLHPERGTPVLRHLP